MADGARDELQLKLSSNSVELEQHEQSNPGLRSTQNSHRSFSLLSNNSLDQLIMSQRFDRAPSVDYVMSAASENPHFQHRPLLSLQPSLTLSQLGQSRLLLESKTRMKAYAAQMMLTELATHQTLQALQHELQTVSSRAYRTLMTNMALRDQPGFEFPSSWACPLQLDRASPSISGALEDAVSHKLEGTCQKPTSKIPVQVQTSNKPQKVGRKWRVQYDKLALYQAQRGIHMTPRSCQADRKLVSWVGEQRKQYKCFQQGIETPLTQARMDLLNKIGFVWNAHEAAWDRNFHELVSLNKIYGTWTVPVEDPDYRKLGLWVKEQRRQKKLMDQGKRSHMTGERIRRLENAGFCFYPRKCCKDSS